MTIADGIYPGMSYEEYERIDALRGSSILHMRRSPMRYRHELDNPTPPSAAMILGTATHRMILEPDEVDDFAIWGELPDHKVRRGRVWDEFRSDNQGKQIVTIAERNSMVGMAAGSRMCAPIMKYVRAKGQCEVSMVWTDRVNGRRFKGRLDKILPKGHYIFDLKTCRDCSSYGFGKQSYALGYHIKMAMYANGYEILTGHKPHVRLGAIESKAPHESAVYRVTSDVILQGLEELDVLVKRISECERTGLWPAAEEVETDLILPAWSKESPEMDLSEFAMEESDGN